MKQIYLHIGLHKTGTTYMQKVFTDNRGLLRSLGVEYPNLGAEFLLGHHNVAWSFIPDKPLIAADNFSLDHFFDYLSACEYSTILISSEDFDFLRPWQIQRLGDRLVNFKVNVLVYVRQPLSALYSYWQESVKHGDTTLFKDYCLQILDKPTALNYGRILDDWSNNFGIDALSIIVYENLLEDNENIALYCLQNALAIDTRAYDFSLPQSRINVASDTKIIELIRQINSLYKTKNNTKTIPSKFLERLRQYFDIHHMEYIENLDEILTHETLDQPQYQPLYQHFQQMQGEVMKKYGDRVFNAKTVNDLFKKQLAQSYEVTLIPSDSIKEVLDLEAIYECIIL